MLRNTSSAVVRPYVPTLAEIQQRRAELLGFRLQPQREQHTQPPEPDPYPPPSPNPAPPAESPLTSSPAANPKLGEAALHGLAGLAVRTIAPHTEGHPASILLQLLAAFGNLAGRGPHCMADATRHGLNLFVVLVGGSSKARKGTEAGFSAFLYGPHFAISGRGR